MGEGFGMLEEEAAGGFCDSRRVGARHQKDVRQLYESRDLSFTNSRTMPNKLPLQQRDELHAKFAVRSILLQTALKVYSPLQVRERHPVIKVIVRHPRV